MRASGMLFASVSYATCGEACAQNCWKIMMPVHCCCMLGLRRVEVRPMHLGGASWRPHAGACVVNPAASAIADDASASCTLSANDTDRLSAGCDTLRCSG